MRGNALDPWPLELRKLELFLVVGVGAGYRTLDDDCSMITTSAKTRGLNSLSPRDENVVSSLVSSPRRKGYFSHSQKVPVFMSSLLLVVDTIDRGGLLLCFLFGLRKSEALMIGNSISLIFDQHSIALDLRKAVLKNNRVSAVGVACSCVGGQPGPSCLRYYRDSLEKITDGVCILTLLKRRFPALKESNTHSLRIGLLLTLFGQKCGELDLLMHLRWSSQLMAVCYARCRALCEVPAQDLCRKILMYWVLLFSPAL
jgi:hypothetical protein